MMASLLKYPVPGPEMAEEWAQLGLFTAELTYSLCTWLGFLRAWQPQGSHTSYRQLRAMS